MADHWLDVIPAVPLARGVPVVHLDGSRGIVHEVTDDGTMAVVVYAPPVTVAARPFTQAVADLRIDLDDPQGMAYALRLVCQHDRDLDTLHAAYPHGALGLTQHLYRLGLGLVPACDADRLAVARALAGVTP